MDAQGPRDERAEPAWRTAEREYDDWVIDRTTLPVMFETSARRNADGDAQLYKGGVYDRSLADGPLPEPPAGEYGAITYAEMRGIVRRLAAGFRDLGVEPGDRVAVYASTRAEWALTDWALLAAGAVVTTVYTDSSREQVRYLLDDPDATGVVVENAELLETALAVEDGLECAFFVSMDELDADGAGGDADGDGNGNGERDGTDPVARDDVCTLGELYDRGDAAFDPDAYEGWLDERDPEDLASVIYTSGTTGRPKGVRLTHRNFRENVNQVYRRLGPRPDKDPEMATIDAGTRSIAFLPLAHVFERLAGHFTMFGAGATVGYVENPDTLADDIALIRPTTGSSVPRVYERIYDRMRERADESPVKRRIFDWSVGVAREWTRTEDPGLGLRARRAVADRLVYGTLRENLGGEIEFMVSGGGSLSEDLCATFNGMGLRVVEGYGLTETAPVVSVNPPEDVRPGTMGVPVADLDVAIDEEVVDGDAFDDAEGTVGELLVRGPNVSPGYWNDPEATDGAFLEALPVRDGGSDAVRTGRDAITGDATADDDAAGDGPAAATRSQSQSQSPDADGGPDDRGKWFRTGDLVERTPDDYLIYHDRLKEVLVLSTGKNVAPQPIEDRFATSDRIDQIMVVGDERKFVGALVVPNVEALRRWAAEEGIDLPSDDEALCRDERAREWVGEAVAAVNEDLGRIERIKDFELVTREWTTENDLLTPSMKKKRRNITDEFRDRIERIYAGD